VSERAGQNLDASELLNGAIRHHPAKPDRINGFIDVGAGRQTKAKGN
jgi:hypothetical protein